MFRIGYRQFLQIWKKASKAAEFKIAPQVLRKWHLTMLGELMVPDRFVDVFREEHREVFWRNTTQKKGWRDLEEYMTELGSEWSVSTSLRACVLI